MLNIVVTLGLARRIGRGGGLAPTLPGGPQLSSSPGTAIGRFEATGTRGERVTRDALEFGTVVAFLSAGCEPCHEVLPDYLSYASANTGKVVSVLSGEHEAEVIAALEAAGPVILEEPNGPTARAFGVVGVPVFVTVGVGDVAATDTRIRPESRLDVRA
ncbi:hypothetical protein [Microbispora hainanensis]|uniref:Thioredoxin domain-containing protein n=1 Tax=Microbispora hainanensis TaxID=568844 RepID=A0A544Z1X7_9ACTN|nr:hypothetical protein [Microbispora hainanensis]TQS22901.1 hypothetical protein FLX08_06055 [Microbispora hainanensis]